MNSVIIVGFGFFSYKNEIFQIVCVILIKIPISTLLRMVCGPLKFQYINLVRLLLEFKAYSVHEIEGPDLKPDRFICGGTVRKKDFYLLGCGEKVQNLCPSLELKRQLSARSDV